jgi:hypothetical protein
MSDGITNAQQGASTWLCWPPLSTGDQLERAVEEAQKAVRVVLAVSFADDRQRYAIYELARPNGWVLWAY